MALFDLAVGDVGTIYTFTLTDSDGTAIDLSGKTVTLRYDSYPTASGSATSRTLTVSDAANGVCTWTTISGDTTAAGYFQFNIRATSSGVQETFRSDTYIFRVVAVV